MLIPKIDARYVHMENAQVTLGKYTDGSLALFAEDVDEEGMPNHEVFSVSLTAYDLTPDEDCVYIKDDAEHTGLAQALAALGLGEIIGSAYYGPFGTKAHEFKLADALIEEAGR